MRLLRAPRLPWLNGGFPGLARPGERRVGQGRNSDAAHDALVELLQRHAYAVGSRVASGQDDARDAEVGVPPHRVEIHGGSDGDLEGAGVAVRGGRFPSYRVEQVREVLRLDADRE